MSGPRPWMGDPEAPTTLTQARARIPRGQVPFSICTCWTDNCGPAACARSGSAAAIATHHAFGCLVTMFLLLPTARLRRALYLRCEALRSGAFGASTRVELAPPWTPQHLTVHTVERWGLFPLLAERATLELELDVPQLDDVVVDQVVLLHLLVVDEGAVRAVQVGDLELTALVTDGGVLARDLLVGQHHVAVRRRAEHVLPHPQAEVLALVLPVERHQPAAHLPLLRVLGALAQVGQVDHRRAMPRRGHRHGHPSAAPAGRLHGHLLLHLQAIGAHVPGGVHDVPVGAHLPLLLAALEEGQDAIHDL